MRCNCARSGYLTDAIDDLKDHLGAGLSPTLTEIQNKLKALITADGPQMTEAVKGVAKAEENFDWRFRL
jgi:hypothetical protein